MPRTVLALICCLSLGVAPCGAYTITVDGSQFDWAWGEESQDNLGHVCRGAGSIGQYCWEDPVWDARTDFAEPDPRVDLARFWLTADADNLYFMAQFMGIDPPATGDGATQIQVAIDTNAPGGGGTDWFGGFANTKVDPNAQWEYLLMTRFGSGNYNLILWHDGFVGPDYVGATALTTGPSVIEASVPWSALPAVTLPAMLRFTVTTYHATPADNAWEVGEGDVANAMDAITNYGDPGDDTSNTWAEVSDGIVNYYFDVFFEADGEPGPPVVVAHVLYDPGYPEPNNEFYRLYNRTPWTSVLGNHGVTGYKIGDEEVIGDGEGMRRIPPGYGSIAPGGYLTIACDAIAVAGNYGITADLEQTWGASDDPGVPNLLAYPTWATGSISLGNTGDEMILVDGCDTVVDVLVYENGTYGDERITPQTYNCDQNEMLYRTPPWQDTDDCSADFAPMVVPVALVSFTAGASPDGVILSWETASESDNLGFNLYRATGAQDRVRLNAELIPGAGTTLDPQQYSFVDDQVSAGETYRYWLEQVDIAGNVEMFGPVAIVVPGTLPGSLTLAVSPVPAREGGTVSLALPQAGRVRVGIYDLSGRRVLEVFDGALAAGAHSLAWSRGALASGTYFVRAIAPAGWVTAPMVVR